MRDRAADRAPVAHLRVADERRPPARRRAQSRSSTGSEASCACRVSAPIAIRSPVVAHVAQIVEPADVDEHRRSRDAELQRRDQRMPSGEQLRVLVGPSSSIASSTERGAPVRRTPRGSCAGPRGGLDRAHDVVVARAATEVALERVPDLAPPSGSDAPSGARRSPSRSRACSSRTGAPCCSWNACCTGCSSPSRREALDRRHLAAVRLHGEHRARLHGLAVERGRCTRRTTRCRSRRSSPSVRARSRRKYTSSCRGSTSASRRSPLTVNATFVIRSPPGAPSTRSRRCTGGRHAARRGARARRARRCSTACVEPTVPDSPMPFTPITLFGRRGHHLHPLVRRELRRRRDPVPDERAVSG